MRKTPLLIGTSLAGLASLAVLCTLSTLPTGAVAQDRGLTAATHALGGAYWQARFEHQASALIGARSAIARPLALGLPGPPLQTLRLLSDYQFSTLRLGDTGGLRLTGGLLINLRSLASTAGVSGAPEGSGALPYAGIGYSSGNLRGEWALSADLGLAAPGLSPARVDRLFGASTALGPDTSPRLLPMIRLGMNMAF